MPSARKRLLEEAIIRHGGTVHQDRNSSVTHIIVARDHYLLRNPATKADLASWCSNGAVVVNPDWAVQCNLRKCILDDDSPYRLWPPAAEDSPQLEITPQVETRSRSPDRPSKLDLLVDNRVAAVHSDSSIDETQHMHDTENESERWDTTSIRQTTVTSDSFGIIDCPQQLFPDEQLVDPSFDPEDGQLMMAEVEWDSKYLPSGTTMPDTRWAARSRPFLACQVRSDGGVVNKNEHITKELERMEELYANVGDKWRKFGYRKTVGILKRYPQAIKTKKDLQELADKRIKGIGAKMIKKIDEILTEGKLKKRQTLEQDPRIQSLEAFGKIHGVGGATAQRWYSLGLRTLEDVHTSDKIQLSETQKVGLRFYEDKLQRIPRAEVAAIEEWVRKAAISIMDDLMVVCCGSYRRGKPSSGDCDVLISFPDLPEGESSQEHLLGIEANPHNRSIDFDYSVASLQGSSASSSSSSSSSELCVVNQSRRLHATSIQPSSTLSRSQFLGRLLQVLREGEHAFITADLTSPDKEHKHGQASYMGFCMLPRTHPQYSGTNRRLDIKVYPAAHFPFALLYFTGSDHFNRSMRFYAKKNGWTLSDHGLSRAVRVNGSKVHSSKSVFCKTERDIFDAMNLEYVPPHQRNCYENFDTTSPPSDGAGVKSPEKTLELKTADRGLRTYSRGVGSTRVVEDDVDDTPFQPEVKVKTEPV